MAAGLASLASCLEHDVGGVVVGLEEIPLGVAHEARYAVFPRGVALGEVEHESRAVQIHGVVVGPLCLSKLDQSHTFCIPITYLVDSLLGAVLLVACTVVHLEFIGDKSDLLRPVVHLGSGVYIQVSNASNTA